MRKWWWRGGPITVSNAPYHGPPPSTRPTQTLRYDGSKILWAIDTTDEEELGEVKFMLILIDL